MHAKRETLAEMAARVARDVVGKSEAEIAKVFEAVLEAATDDAWENGKFTSSSPFDGSWPNG